MFLSVDSEGEAEAGAAKQKTNRKAAIADLKVRGIIQCLLRLMHVTHEISPPSCFCQLPRLAT